MKTKLAFLFLILFFPVLASHADAEWYLPAKFKINAADTKLRLFLKPEKTSKAKTVSIKDIESLGHIYAEIRDVSGDFVLVQAQTQEGWLEQTELHKVSSNKMYIMDINGNTEGKIALPKINPNYFYSEYQSGFLIVDNGDSVLKINLQNNSFINYSEKSDHFDIVNALNKLGFINFLYLPDSKEIWGYDYSKKTIFSYNRDESKIKSSHKIFGLPEISHPVLTLDKVTDIAKIGNDFYLWGQDTEMSGSQLIKTTLKGTKVEAEILSEYPGLFVQLNKNKIMFFPNNEIDENEEESFEITNGDKSSIKSPKFESTLFFKIIYIEKVKKFIGFMKSI